jgi:hypothetical protein
MASKAGVTIAKVVDKEQQEVWPIAGIPKRSDGSNKRQDKCINTSAHSAKSTLSGKR